MYKSKPRFQVRNQTLYQWDLGQNAAILFSEVFSYQCGGSSSEDSEDDEPSCSSESEPSESEAS